MSIFPPRVAKRAAVLVAALALTLSSLLTTTAPAAHATAPCNTALINYPLIGGNLSPHYLHGYRVYLCYSDAAPGPNALPFRAWAKAVVPSGAILSIDRSKNQMSQEWPTTSQVSGSGGGWTYQEKTSTGTGGYTTVGYQEALYNAVRICLRLNGSLACQSTWFADQDL